MSGGDNVKVAVRVRPFNRRELELGTKCVIQMESDQTIIHHPSEASQRKQPKTFAFDHCFWSFDEKDDHFSNQAQVFQALGLGVLENAFLGYNACIFAYGQTGSGKTYTMMGSPENQGLVPRLCSELFQRMTKEETDSLTFKVEVSYMEIYNEKVRDLLDPCASGKHNLKVREHNILGPYVDGLQVLAVSGYEQILSLMEEGNKSRTVASTNMNAESSRSHAVFNITVTQTLTDLQSGVSGEKVSKVSLVDLAGSERAQKTGAMGDRLKEGSNINKSLTTLGLVISALADMSSGKRTSTKFVPYRDSVLTWLLKDNLGGNSRTIMVAAISPAADNYEESLSTLRYADRAKRIVQHAVVNEDPNAKIIRELREEVEQLRAMLDKQSMSSDLQERLHESEKLMSEMSRTWEERLAETERLHKERQEALEAMGISVQASGIKIEEGKFYLVNLNPDPSLNELLVYYLKEKTLVGQTDAPVPQDIQLRGVGIMPQHATLSLEDQKVWVQPMDGARTCVNGTVVASKTQLKHGDRVLWGNNHFFRVNCPVASRDAPTAAPGAAPQRPIDYEFAREELIMQELTNDPVSNAVSSLEKQHEQDKQAALEQQRVMYERQIKLLRSQMSPGTPLTPMAESWHSGRVSTPMSAFPSSNVQAKFVQWAQERDEMFKKSLAKLKEDIVRANSLIREANFLASDMRRHTSYYVTLQIPAANLTPAKLKTGAFVSEPAILVKRKGKGSQIWSMDKLENKLVDMRDLYQDWKDAENQNDEQFSLADPFYESQENHNLIGVANVFLEVLFHDVKLDYQVPIISQQGEVAGRLHVEIYRVATNQPTAEVAAEATEDGTASTMSDSVSLFDATDSYYGSTITCRVCIKKATGLPSSLSNFVFCQYSFFGHPDPVVVPPAFDAGSGGDVDVSPSNEGGVTYTFEHERDFNVTVSDEFLEFVQEGALSIQIWGHKSAGFGSTDRASWDVHHLNAAKSRSLQDRWAEVTRRLSLWVDILELNDAGEYTSVDAQRNPEVLTGCVFQLRQGQQKRISVRVNTVQDCGGQLPLICKQITSVSIGCVCVRAKALQKGLDSYQEEDLNVLRDRWSEALTHRREYLDDQIQRLMHKPDKSESDVEREQALIAQWVALTEERNAVLVPTPNSGVPGAPADWEPPSGMERHIPVLFLDLAAEDMGTSGLLSAECLQAAGVNSLLPKEHGGKMFQLPILNFDENEMRAIASWDSSIHEHPALNRVTVEGERVYAILKVCVRVSHPAEMELVLRKRLSFNIIKKIGFAQRLMKKFTSASHIPSQACGVMYDVVSNIPKATEDPEARETLALVAAMGEGNEGGAGPPDGESYIEKYTKGISAVESILALDRLRQEVSIKELLAERKRRPTKSSSLPDGFSSDPRRRAGVMTTSRSSVPQEKSLLVSSLVSPVSGAAKPIAPQVRRPLNPAIPEEAGATRSAEHFQLPTAVSPPESSQAQPAPSPAATPVATSTPVKATMQPSVTSESLAESNPSAGDVPSTTSSGYGSQALSIQAEKEKETTPLDEATTEDDSCASEDEMEASTQEEDVNNNTSTLASSPAEEEPGERSLVSLASMDRSSYSDYAATIQPTPVPKPTPALEGAEMTESIIDDGSDRDSHRSEGFSVPGWMRLGQRVIYERTEGDQLPSPPNDGVPGASTGEKVLAVVQYCGSVEFSAGVWVGIELETPTGKHNGSLGGIRYFSCADNYGLFVPPESLSRAPREARRPGSGRRPPRPPFSGSVKQQVVMRRSNHGTPQGPSPSANPPPSPRTARRFTGSGGPPGSGASSGDLSGSRAKSGSTTSLNSIGADGRRPSSRSSSSKRVSVAATGRAGSASNLNSLTRPTAASMARSAVRQ